MKQRPCGYCGERVKPWKRKGRRGFIREWPSDCYKQRPTATVSHADSTVSHADYWRKVWQDKERREAAERG